MCNDEYIYMVENVTKTKHNNPELTSCLGKKNLFFVQTRYAILQCTLPSAFASCHLLKLSKN
jgi:hypothetical protein